MSVQCTRCGRTCIMKEVIDPQPPKRGVCSRRRRLERRRGPCDVKRQQERL